MRFDGTAAMFDPYQVAAIAKYPKLYEALVAGGMPSHQAAQQVLEHAVARNQAIARTAWALTRIVLFTAAACAGIVWAVKLLRG
jgi:hypothetical protein